VSLPKSLLEQIFALAHDIPLAAMGPLIRAIATAPQGQWTAISNRVQDAIAHPHYRKRASSLVEAWRSFAPELSPIGFAAAIESGAYCLNSARREQTIELVWTGPQSSIGLRRTDQALLQLIDRAEQNIIIVAFAIYNIPEIRSALVIAADRGVQLRIIIESAKESEGKITYDGLVALGTQVAMRAQVYRWPNEKRPMDNTGKKGSLHVKCAVADASSLLLSSANLTEYALYLNMEMGLLVSGGSLPAQVAHHFNELIERGDLVPVR
jgi:phosphatidylserine/phosphatidylglycerophosphate/cardiolipin synthase-like enzyme